jgi:hypothetical protein
MGFSSWMMALQNEWKTTLPCSSPSDVRRLLQSLHLHRAVAKFKSPWCRSPGSLMRRKMSRSACRSSVSHTVPARPARPHVVCRASSTFSIISGSAVHAIEDHVLVYYPHALLEAELRVNLKSEFRFMLAGVAFKGLVTG